MPYSNRILQSSSYHNEIRSRLGTDSNTIQDPDIDAPSVLPIAEARVISRVPNYASLSDDDQNFLYAAAIAMVAALLAPSMPTRIKKSESDADYKYENNLVDWKTRAKELEDEAYNWIDYISTQTVVELPQMSLAGPTRTAQIQQASNGGTNVYPNDADISIYPTNIE